MIKTVLAYIVCSAAVVLAQVDVAPLSDAERNSAEHVSFDALQQASVEVVKRTAECGEAAQNHIAVVGTPIASFTAAKIAWVIGKPATAIAILDKVREKHGEDPMPAQLGTGVTTDIVCNSWIACIARQSGDIPRAKKAFEDLLAKASKKPELGALGRIILLYNAEVEFRVCGNAERALQLLRSAQSEMPVDEQRRDACIMYDEWAAFQERVIQGEQMEANRSLQPSSFKSNNMALLAMGQLVQMGIAAAPRASMYHDAGEALAERNLSLVMESSTTDIDRMLVRLMSAFLHQERKDYATAEGLYLSVFKDQVFFSPEAGIMAARCQRASGRAEDADASLKRVRERFPHYLRVVDQEVNSKGM